VNSFLTGRRGVSLPFTDYCEPIIDGGIKLEDLLDLIIEYGKKCSWKSLELRSVNGLPLSTSPSSTYLGHTLRLTKDHDDLLSKFRDSTRRNIKKAVKEGMNTEISNSLESIKEFYRLNCMTRKQHGLPPQPFIFFEGIYDHIISKNLGLIVLAFYEQKAIAGAVYFHFGEKAVYKYGASDMEYQSLRANNLVMWEAIKRYSQNGFKNLCFGRSERENSGLIQFKSSWGTTEQQINYYKYDLKKGSFVSSPLRVTGFHNKIFKNMPLPILKKVGSILYKHAG
jgi:lipid II:glycine glycyltransferase (peptidoglycan interpeptide bridge formation enzyme)